MPLRLKGEGSFLYTSDDGLVDVRARLHLQAARYGEALTYTLEIRGNVDTPRKHRAQQSHDESDQDSNHTVYASWLSNIYGGESNSQVVGQKKAIAKPGYRWIFAKGWHYYPLVYEACWMLP